MGFLVVLINIMVNKFPICLICKMGSVWSSKHAFLDAKTEMDNYNNAIISTMDDLNIPASVIAAAPRACKRPLDAAGSEPPPLRGVAL